MRPGPNTNEKPRYLRIGRQVDILERCRAAYRGTCGRQSTPEASPRWPRIMEEWWLFEFLEEADNERACPIGVLGSRASARRGNFRCCD